MCFSKSRVHHADQQAYETGVIIQDCIVPSGRPVAGRGRDQRYDVDIREFLVTSKNALLQKTINVDVKKYVNQHFKIPAFNWAYFTSSKKGSFDFRADVLTHFVGQKIKYVDRGDEDYWLFPDETLQVCEGDCKDTAILLASLMIASGISPYNVRVALGTFTSHDGKTSYDHSWVAYKNETAHWTPMEISYKNAESPKIKEAPDGNQRFAYHPKYVFNGDHLWTATADQSTFSDEVRKNWSTMHPKFGGEVHQHILTEALAGDDPQLSSIRDALTKRFEPYAGQLVDRVDDPFHTPYSPFDHFDNGYIAESMDLLQQRFTGVQDAMQSSADYSKVMENLAYVFHAMADFYAHSTYAHFAPADGEGNIPYCDLIRFDMTDDCPTADYTQAPFNIDSATSDFSINTELVKDADRPAVAEHWNQKLISGRYTQNHDPFDVAHPDMIEQNTVFPDKLLHASDFKFRGGLPHHDEIAVDGEVASPLHKLYTDPTVYTDQYNRRFGAAVRHIRQTYQDAFRVTLPAV